MTGFACLLRLAHAMTPEDVHHFRAIGRATTSGVYYFGSFSEVRGAYYRGGYDGELTVAAPPPAK